MTFFKIAMCLTLLVLFVDTALQIGGLSLFEFLNLLLISAGFHRIATALEKNQ